MAKKYKDDLLKEFVTRLTEAKYTNKSYAEFEENFNKHIANMKKKFLKKEDDNRRRNIMIDVIYKGLSYRPEDRKLFKYIVKKMKESEGKLGKIKYRETENKFKEELKEKLMLKLDYSVLESEIKCKDCRNGLNAKAEFECKHEICNMCLKDFVTKNFLMGTPYNKRASCPFCNAPKSISIF